MIIPLDKSQGEFEERDLLYIKLLEAEPNFEELVINARKACGIKEPLKNYTTGSLVLKANAKANEIVRLYSLPTSWVIPISGFIVLGKFKSPGKGVFLSGLAYKTTREGARIRATDFSIVITQKTSFDTLRRWLFKNKSEIERHLKKLPSKNPNFKKNMEQRIEIFKLSNEGYKPKKIHELLRKRFPLEEQYNVPTEPEISKIVYEIKKKLKRKSL